MGVVLEQLKWSAAWLGVAAGFFSRKTYLRPKKRLARTTEKFSQRIRAPRRHYIVYIEERLSTLPTRPTLYVYAHGRRDHRPTNYVSIHTLQRQTHFWRHRDRPRRVVDILEITERRHRYWTYDSILLSLIIL